MPATLSGRPPCARQRARLLQHRQAESGAQSAYPAVHTAAPLPWPQLEATASNNLITLARQARSQPAAAGECLCDLAWPVVDATSTTRCSDGSAATLHASMSITRGASGAAEPPGATRSATSCTDQQGRRCQACCLRSDCMLSSAPSVACLKAVQDEQRMRPHVLHAASGQSSRGGVALCARLLGLESSMLGLAWGYPWPPAVMAYAPQVFSSTVCRPCSWKSAGAAPGGTQSRRECCAAPAGPASWDGGAVVAERLCVNVRKRAQASSHAHAAAVGSPQAPGVSKRGALAPTMGGGAPGSRVTVVPRCKMREAACRACPLWTRQGCKRSSESPCTLSEPAMAPPGVSRACVRRPARRGCGTRRLRAGAWTASLEACCPSTWAGGQHVCWAWLGGTPGCTLTMEGPLPGPWAPRCVRLRTPSFSSTLAGPVAGRVREQPLGGPRAGENVAPLPLGPPPGTVGPSLLRGCA